MHTQYRRGNLWPYSTAKLEARGARCKHVIRRQTSARPRAAAGGTKKTKHSIAKRLSAADKRKGLAAEGTTVYKAGYNSSQMTQLLGMVALREARMLSTKTAHFKRESSQLASLGKLKGEHKVHSEVPAAFDGIVPKSNPFTCMSVFESIMKGEFPPLYGTDGVCMRSDRD